MSPRRSEVRYQFETRSVDLAPALRRLSRKLRRLTFRLVTLCLDDGDVQTWEIRAGAARERRISDRRRAFHWDAARRKFGLSSDEAYADDDATRVAEDRMCAEALGSWEKRAGRSRRLNWSGRPVFLTLDHERTSAIAAAGALAKQQ